MLPGRAYSIKDVGRIIKKRWWVALLPCVLGIMVGVAGYAWLPVYYRSETLIMVVPQRVPDNYVKPTVTTDIADRVRSISEQILSRSRLERIIQDFNLYAERRKTDVMEDVVQRMRTDIVVDLDGKEGKESSFRVSYSNSDPKVAQKVTERLASLFIDENLRDRATLADNTSQFLESQLQDAKTQLIAQEKRLEEYRRKYAGELPTQVAANLQTIQAAQLQLQSLGESMNRARERRLLVERQIADVQTLPPDMMMAGIPAASPEAGQVLPLTQRLEAARARLELYKSRYTPDHPDVLSLVQQVESLEAQAREEAANPPTADQTKPQSRAEIVRDKRLGDLQAEMKIIDGQLAAAQVEEGRLKRTIEEHQGKIATLPTRESELVELTRDYSTLQETYASLLQKREDSKLAANLERKQIGEQFKILDPASLPERPSNRKQQVGLLVGAPLVGLLLGLILVGIPEYRDSSFRIEEDVVRVLELPVLALIPAMTGGDPTGERRSLGKVRRLGGAANLRP